MQPVRILHWTLAMATPNEVTVPAHRQTGSPAHQNAGSPAHGSAFFGALPSLGIWTPLGLGRAQFFFILTMSVVLFTFIGGPAWRHLHEPHFLRITVSYAAIPFAVAAAYAYNRDRRVVLAIAASAVIALIKLVATALLLMLLSLAS